MCESVSPSGHWEDVISRFVSGPVRRVKILREFDKARLADYLFMVRRDGRGDSRDAKSDRVAFWRWTNHEGDHWGFLP